MLLGLIHSGYSMSLQGVPQSQSKLRRLGRLPFSLPRKRLRRCYISGFGWNVDDSRAVREILGRTLRLLVNAEDRHGASTHGKLRKVYLAL